MIRMKKIFFTVLLTSIFFNVQLKANDMTELTIKQKSIIPIASFAATGKINDLKKSLTIALENGLTINEIKEILIQVYAYAGFPRSLNALNAFMEILDIRKSQGIKDINGPEGKMVSNNTNKLSFGEKIQTELIGAPNKAAYQDFSPTISIFLKEHLFADIFGRGILTYKDREIATVAMLASLEGTEAQLRGHLKIAINIGLTEAQLNEIINIMQNNISQDVSKRANSNLKSILQNKQ